MNSEQIRREQDIAYFKSLYSDMFKEVEIERKVYRDDIEQYLREVVPNTPEDLLTAEQKRLLRLPTAALFPEEITEVAQIKKELLRLHNGGCITYHDADSPSTFKLQIKGILFPFCFDLNETLQAGLVNFTVGLADVIIVLDTEDTFQYPLTEADSTRLIDQIYTTGLNINYATTLRFPELEKLKDDLAILEIS